MHVSRRADKKCPDSASVLAVGESSSQILQRRRNAHVLSQVDLALVVIYRAAVSWPPVIQLICYCC